MADLRIHRYIVDPADVEELRSGGPRLIDAIRAAFPSLIETRLVRLEDGTFIDAWRWDSAEHMKAAPGCQQPSFAAANRHGGEMWEPYTYTSS